MGVDIKYRIIDPSPFDRLEEAHTPQPQSSLPLSLIILPINQFSWVNGLSAAQFNSRSNLIWVIQSGLDNETPYGILSIRFF